MKKSTSPTGLALPVGAGFLRRTLIGAAVTGGVLAVAVAARWGTPSGLGFAVGLIWGIANFWVLALLLKTMVASGNRGQALGLGLLKLALYAAGVGLLLLGVMPPVALVIGFSWLLAVILLRAAGALWIAGGKTQPAGP